MDREIIDLLVKLTANRRATEFIGEAEIVVCFADRFAGLWRARRILRAMTACGAITCCSKRTFSSGNSVSVPWHKSGNEWQRAYRLLPASWAASLRQGA